MNKTIDEAVELATELKNNVGNIDDVDIAICPTAVCLSAVSEVLKNSNIKLGAQNMHWESSGAFTGEVSADMLASCGCSVVILGHSERRQYFGETDANVNKKIKAALATNLTPILCCGETQQQREDGVTEEIVREQIEAGVDGLSTDDAAKLVVAYEPIWAIGTGLTATPQQAQDVHAFIRATLKSKLGAVADSIRIQYGGSVKPDNVKDLMSQADIDGALVGGASLKAESFSDIIRYKEN